MTQDLQELFFKAESLPESAQKQLAIWMAKEIAILEVQASNSADNTPQLRIMGLFAPAWMSDDFNDELPDDFWGWDQ